MEMEQAQAANGKSSLKDETSLDDLFARLDRMANDIMAEQNDFK